MIDRRAITDTDSLQSSGAPVALLTRPRVREGVFDRASESGLFIRYSGVEEDEARDSYVRAHPKSTVFHLAGWSRAIERTFGARRHDLIAT